MYVDGYVIPIAADKVDQYRKIARFCGKIWREHGALEYRECVADDLDVGFGTPFPKLAKIKPGETVLFSYVVFRNRKHRDSVNAKVMKDPRMDTIPKDDLPFNVKRISFGGFKPIVSL